MGTRPSGVARPSVQDSALPPDLTNFIGRRLEIDQLLESARTARLLTLVGPGGVGKTRLGTEIARRLEPEFDGVALVELAEVTSPDHIAVAIAQKLNLPPETSGSLLDAVCENLVNRRVLLVLDNCEHLSPVCGTLVSHLIRHAPQMLVLATSREPLGILGEVTWAVAPLELPVEASTGSPNCDAVDLFVERAKSATPDFAPGVDELRAVGELCRQLDGIPLAIELASVRLRSFSVEQILAQRAALFEVLDRGNRGGPARHQTLRAAIRWSYDLCTSGEQAVWERLAVFTGSFELDAAEQVCSGDGITAPETVQLIGELVEKSVITRASSGSGRRYRLLESIRIFGLEMCGAIDVLRDRHRDYYLKLAEDGERCFLGAGQFEITQRLEGELPNIRAALEHSLGRPGTAIVGLRMAAALWFYWNACGHLRDGCHWLGRALEVNPGPTPERAKALWVLGWYEMLQAETQSSRDHLTECGALAEEIGDAAAAACAQQFLGTVEEIGGNFDAALDLLEAAVERYETAGQLNALAILCGAQVGFVHCLSGNLDEAVRACDSVLAVGGVAGERFATSWVLWVRGLAHHLRGDVHDSMESLRRSMELKLTLNDWIGAATCVEVMAWNSVEAGEPTRAARLLGIGDMLCGSMGGTAPLFGDVSLIATRERCSAQARAQLGTEEFEQEYAVGLMMQPAAAVSFGLGEPTEPAASRRTPAPSEHGNDPLTSRETQISGLIADGLSNIDVAEKLTISRRTVEGHVNRILAKLNFKSRSQIAAWMTRREAAGR